MAQEVAVLRPHFEKAYTGPDGVKPDSTARAMDDARARDERATNIFAGAAKAYADENLKAANGMATNEAAVFKDGIAMIVRLYSDRNDFAHNNGFFDLSPEERLPKLERILKDVERMRQFSTEERNGLGVAVEAHMRRHYRKEKGQWTVNLAASTEVLAARERKRAAQELKTTEPQL